MVFSRPWHSTSPSRWALASKWFSASSKGMPVSSERISQTRRPNSGCVLMPVPTAVPPTGSSRTASMAAAARLDRKLQSAGPIRRSPGPSVSGVASARCVRPILRISCHSPRFFFERLGAFATTRARVRSWIADGRGHVNRRGKDVVRALPHVHVVVRMDRLFAGEAVAAGKFDRPIGDHLVGVHVARRARAGLIDIDGKLVVETPVGHFAAGGRAMPRPASRRADFCPSR